MNYRSLVVIILALILSACQTAAPNPESTEYPAPAAGTQVEYPAPAAGAQVEYPAPAKESAPAIQASSGTINSIYPGMADGEAIQWTQIEAMAFNSEIARIVLSDTLAITVTLKDGRSFTSELPGTGFETALIQACAEACKDIELVSK